MQHPYAKGKPISEQGPPIKMPGKRKIFHLIFLGLLVLLYWKEMGVAGNPPRAGRGPDEMLHLSNHVTMQNHFRTGLPLRQSPLVSSLRKPHLPYLVSNLFVFLFSGGYATVLMANLLFTFLWLVMVYWVGCRFFNPVTGLTAVLILIGFPMTWFISEHLGNDIQVSFAVVLTFVFLLHAQRVPHWYWWPVLGVLLAFGFLAKPTLPLFLAGPLLWLYGLLLRDSFKQKRWGTMVAIHVGGALSLLVWYLILSFFFPHLLRRMLYLWRTVVAEATSQDFALFHTIAGDWAFMDMVVYLGWLGTLVVTAGIFISLTQLKKKENILLFAGLAPGLLVLIPITEAFTRFLMPALFIPVLFAVYAITRIPYRLFAYALLALLSFFSLVNYFALHPNVAGQWFPQHDRVNMAFTGDVIVDDLKGRETDGRHADLLYLNYCPLQMGPYYYFTMIAVQDAPPVAYVHMWTDFATFPGQIFHHLLPERAARVGYLLICSLETLTAGAVKTRLDGVQAAVKELARNRSLPASSFPDFQYQKTFDVKYDRGLFYPVQLWVSIP